MEDGRKAPYRAVMDRTPPNLSASRPSGNQYTLPLRTPQHNKSGETVSLRDSRTGVSIKYTTNPQASSAEPFLSQSGAQASKHLYAPIADPPEGRYQRYRKQGEPNSFFTIGVVFSILWLDRHNESIVDEGDSDDETKRNPGVQAPKTRSYVVISEGGGCCIALRFSTYRGRGAEYPGLIKAEHSIIYAGRDAPSVLSGERPNRGESGLLPTSIRVVPACTEDRLDPMSRLNYAEVNIIQHDVRVKHIGKVHADYISALLHQFSLVWHNRAVASSKATVKSQGTATAPCSAPGSSIPSKRRDSHSRQHESDDSENSSENEKPRVKPTPPIQRQQAAALIQDQLRAHAAAAIPQLIAKGHTREEAIRMVNEAYRKKVRETLGNKADEDSDGDGDSDSDSDDG